MRAGRCLWCDTSSFEENSPLFPGSQQATLLQGRSHFRRHFWSWRKNLEKFCRCPARSGLRLVRRMPMTWFRKRHCVHKKFLRVNLPHQPTTTHTHTYTGYSVCCLASLAYNAWLNQLHEAIESCAMPDVGVIATRVRKYVLIRTTNLEPRKND
jgi:hypothetical protein